MKQALALFQCCTSRVCKMCLFTPDKHNESGMTVPYESPKQECYEISTIKQSTLTTWRTLITKVRLIKVILKLNSCAQTIWKQNNYAQGWQDYVPTFFMGGGGLGDYTKLWHLARTY